MRKSLQIDCLAALLWVAIACCVVFSTVVSSLTGTATTQQVSAVLTGKLMGTAGSFNSAGNTIAKALDGKSGDFFDGPTANGNWVGYDLGQHYFITSVSWAARPQWPQRLVGGIFQGANKADFSDAIALDTIQSAGTSLLVQTAPVNWNGSFEFVRYLSPAGSYGNISQLSFSGYSDPSAVTAAQVNPVVTNFGANYPFGANSTVGDPLLHMQLAGAQRDMGEQWVRVWFEYPTYQKSGDSYWQVCRNWKKAGYRVLLQYNAYQDQTPKFSMPAKSLYMAQANAIAASNAVDAVSWGNEIDSTSGQVYYNGTLTQMSVMLADVAPVMHSAGIINIAPSFVHNPAWRDTALKAGIYVNMDGCDGHFYGSYSSNATTYAQHYAWCLVNKLQCWCTETGFNNGNLIQHAAQMQAMLQSMNSVGGYVFPWSQLPNGTTSMPSPLSSSYVAVLPEYAAWKTGMTVPSATTKPVSLLSDGAGNITVTYGGNTVCSGTIDLYGTNPTTQSTTTLPGGSVDIVQQYVPWGITADFVIAVIANDIYCTLTLTNGGQDATSPVEIVYPAFKFTSQPYGTMASWHSSYLAANGLSVYHPSVGQPLGCTYAGDADYCVSFWSPTEYNKQSLVNAEWVADGVLPNPLTLDFYTTVAVTAGQTVSIGSVLRVTDDQSLGGRLSGYKTLMQPVAYDVVSAPIMAFQAIDPSWVTATDPYGYSESGATPGYRRIDTADGVQKYLAAEIPRLKALGALGVIFWAPGGVESQLYPIDFDINLQRISSTWPSLVKGFKDAGFRVGICARVCDKLNADGSYGGRVDPTNALDMTTLFGRTDAVAKTGVDMWYLDSSGGSASDGAVIAALRARYGHTHQFFSEMTTDLLLQNASVYCEWTGVGCRWDSTATQADLQYLYDSKPMWWCCDRSGTLNTPQSFATLGFQPLIGD